MAWPTSPTAGDTYTAGNGSTYQYAADGGWRVITPASLNGYIKEYGTVPFAAEQTGVDATVAAGHG